MTNENSTPRDKSVVFAECEKIGEAAVLADLERGGRFYARVEAPLAWEWVYEQRIKRDRATGEALRITAKQTMFVAVGTFFVALFTASLVAIEYFSR